MTNIYDTIRHEVGSYNGVAIADGEAQLCYSNLWSKVDCYADDLAAIGITKDARIGVDLENSIDYIPLSLAILKLNAVIVPISVHVDESELEEIIQKIELNFVLTRRQNVISQLALNTKINDMNCYVITQNEVKPLPLQAGHNAAFIRFSSGTTGASKGVILSHDAVLERTSACKNMIIGEGESVLWVLDMAYHFVVTIILFLRRKAKIVLVRSPLEREIPLALRQNKINLLYATPYHYRLLTQSGEVTVEMLKDVKQAISTAMPLSVNEAQGFYEKFKISLTQGYGIIEVGLPCLNDNTTADYINSVGRLQPDYRLELREGVIFLSGPGMFNAYFSPFTLRTDHWFNTGDMGRLDANGYLFIEGRAKSVINYLGMKIFPAEIEQLMQTFSEIEELYVYGKKDTWFGEIPVAVVVLNDGLAWSRELEDSFRYRCREKLPAHKIPKEFEVVSKLERTISGKIKRPAK